MCIDQESTRFRMKSYRNRKESEKKRGAQAGRSELFKSGKDDNDRGIYRLPKEERASRLTRHPDRTACSIGQSVRSAGLLDRLTA